VQSFITRRPVLTYFVLAFGISWGGGLFVLGPSRIPTEASRLLPRRADTRRGHGRVAAAVGRRYLPLVGCRTIGPSP
jgi:hypothetical protein